MSRLAGLKGASSLHDLAQVLGYSAKGLAYIIYGVPDGAKYVDFTIPKRSGGTRTISAPVLELKRLQKHLAHLIEDCVIESDANRKIINTISHGFRRKHSIMTNASRHRKRRYVFNIDLHDFFGAINFGRVWRYFEKNRDFSINSDVAKTIAQIACHNRSLPQGSPCSPVISNLIAHILDIRMMQIASKAKCHYSRYADDLTFSTNEKNFPSRIAKIKGATTEWEVGKQLAHEIRRCGFELNPTKTRMQFKSHRQDVTGIVVNKKVNVRSEYARTVRAMVNSLVKKGEFTIEKTYRDEKGAWQMKPQKGTDAKLRGMLSFIDSVRQFEKNKGEKKKGAGENQPPRIDLQEMEGASRVYRKFLLYTQFFRPDLPFFICEGKTDNVYIRCALRSLAENFPTLIEKKDGKCKLNINLFNYSKIADRILHLGGGTGDMCNFIGSYGNEFKGFHHIGKRNPIIILVDNDSGATPIFATIKKVTKSPGAIDGSQELYWIRDNLYVVPIPKISGKDTPIEKYFDRTVLERKLGGKVFSGEDKFDASTQYGKHLFAEHIVKKDQNIIDFSRFAAILTRMQDVLAVHAAKA